MSAVIAETTRGGIVESVHQGVVVAVDTDGEVIASAGDPETVVFFRSSAKPFQAIPVIESGAADGFGLTAAELALCCASHEGSPEHQQQVAAMLAKFGMSSADLQCGCVFPGNEAEAARVMLGSDRSLAPAMRLLRKACRIARDDRSRGALPPRLSGPRPPAAAADSWHYG